MSLLGELVAVAPPGRSAERALGSILASFVEPGADYGGHATVSPEQGLRVTTAYACNRLIAGLGASMPAKITRRGDKKRQEVRTPEFRHVWGRPNPDMLRQTFWESELLQFGIYGKALSWKGREGRYDPREPWKGIQEIWPLHPKRMRVGVASDSSKVFVLDGDTAHPYTTAEIGHVPNLSLDGVWGLSPIQQNAAAIRLASAAERSGLNFYRQGSLMTGIISSDQVLDTKDVDFLQERWQERQAGEANHWKIPVFGKGAEYKNIAIPPEQAQFLETRGYQREEIVQIYGVPPHMIGLVSKSTSWGTGIEQQFIGFVVTVMIPLLVRFEQMVADELLAPDLEMKFTVQSLLRGDMNARANFYRTLRMIGALSADTILELEDMAPRGIPDDFLSPGNMQRLLVSGGVDPMMGAGNSGGDDDAVAEAFPLVGEARCPGCSALLAKNVRGSVDLHCKKCRAEHHFGPYLGAAALAVSQGEDLPRDQQDLVDALAVALAERM